MNTFHRNSFFKDKKQTTKSKDMLGTYFKPVFLGTEKKLNTKQYTSDHLF